jgi:hypothetical protein
MLLWLKATSRTLLANASGDTDKVAVAAAVDACRMKAGRPPTLREMKKKEEEGATLGCGRELLRHVRNQQK